MTRWISRVGAIVVFGALGTLLVPGCVIRLGSGTGDETDASTTGGSGGSGGQTGTGATFVPTPEEQEAIDAAKKTDPQVLALAQAKAAYAAYALAGLTEAQVSDPQLIDESILMQIIQANEQIAWDLAEQWIATVDATTLSAGYPVNVDCMSSPHYCRSSISCDFAKICVLNDCGDGRCKPCPTKWDLGNVIISGWCTYTCYVGEDIAGTAIALKPRIGGNLVPWIDICRPN